MPTLDEFLSQDSTAEENLQPSEDQSNQGMTLDDFLAEPEEETSPDRLTMEQIKQMDQPLEEAWNPVEIFGSLWGSLSYMGVKTAGRGTLKAVQVALPEATLGTITDLPVSLVSQQVREKYGWGAGITTDLLGGLAAGMTIDRFVMNKFNAFNDWVGSTRELRKLKNLPESEQAKISKEMSDLLSLGKDRGAHLDISGNVKQVDPEEIKSLDNFGDAIQTENIEVKPITAGDAPKRSEKVAARLAYQKDKASREQVVSRARELAPDESTQIIKRKSGKAFVSESSAKRAARRKGLADEDVEITKVDDGYGIKTRKVSSSLDEVTFWKTIEDAPDEEGAKKAIQEMREQANLEKYSDETLTSGRAKTAEELRETPSKELPEEDLASKADLSEREAMIRRVVAKRQGGQITKQDEINADVGHILSGLSPEESAKVPPMKTPTAAEEHHLKMLKEMEDYVGGMDEFQDGIVKHGFEEDVGFNKQREMVSDEYAAYLEDIEADPDAVRGFGDTLQDLYTVFGNKLGMSVEDISKGAPIDKVRAAERLALDLKRHYRQALKSGYSLQQHYVNQGFSDDMASQLSEFTEAVSTLKGKELSKVFSQRLERPDEGLNLVEGASEADVGSFDPWGKLSSRTGSWFSVEHPFRKINAPETGHAFKVFHSVQDAHQHMGLRFIQRELVGDSEIKWGKMNPASRTDALLKAEDDSFDLSHLSKTEQHRVTKAAGKLRGFFDKYFDILQKEEILDEAFPQSYITRKRKAIANKEAKIKEAKSTEEVEKLNKSIESIKEQIRAVEGTKYVPGFSEWLTAMEKTKPEDARKVVRIFNRKERKIPTLRSLLEHKDAQGNLLFSKEDIDPGALLGAYVTRAGSDTANIRLKRAMEAEGLVAKVPTDSKGKLTKSGLPAGKQDWPWVDSSKLPHFKDYVAQSNAKKYLEEFITPIGKHSYYEKLLGGIKMFQFYNPFILGMYNTYQSAMLHGIKSYKIPRHTKEAVSDVMEGSDLYRRLSEYGLTSKPFSNPMGSWQDSVKNAQMPMKNRVLQFSNLLPHKAIKNFYNMSWDMAWSMDSILRTTTARELIERGMSEKRAAQISAMFHGDYASVPPATRRALNKFLFTPTFKIVMGGLYKNMIESAVKAGRDTAKKEMPGLETRALAGGLVGLIAANMGKDMLMKHHGYESDEWGRRYVKEVETDEGSKEVVLTFSDPTNLFLKYIYRGQKSLFGPPSDDTAIGKFLNEMKYELHPLYRIVGLELAQNRTWDGQRIVDPNEDPMTKVGKTMEYAFQNLLPAVQLIGYRPGDSQDREALDKHFGKFLHKALKAVTFPYMRSTEEKRAMYRIRTVIDQIQKSAKDGNLDEEILNNAREKIQRQVKSLEE